MRKIILLFIFLSCAPIFYLGAQVNLVLNPSFEIDTHVPTQPNQIQYAQYWSPIDSNENPDMPGTQPACTSELISEYDTIGAQYDYAPENQFFYHYPRTGHAMCEMEMYGTGYVGGSDIYYHRSYTQGRLSAPLSESISYCVTFYVAFDQGTGYAVNNIGAYIDAGYIDTGMYDTCCLSTLGVVDTYCTQPKSMYTPQILETSVVLDTLGRATNDSASYERRWVKIQGSFVATGGERYITIGVFADDAHTTIIPLIPPPPYFYISCGWSSYHQPEAGYLVDDVSLVRSDAHANAGPDTVHIAAPGDSIDIGNDTAAVGGGAGMPCWWYVYSRGVLSTPIDSGGRIMVHPDSTTTYVEMMSICGNVTYDTITVKIGPEGVSLLSYQHIGIFPNPANNELHVTGIPPNLKYEILNPVGQTMLSGAMKDVGNAINVGSLPGGMYFIALTDENGNKKTMKFIKM